MTLLRLAVPLSTLSLLAAPAYAEEATTAEPASPTRIAVGGEFEVITLASMDAEFGGDSDSASVDSTVGIGASVDYALTDAISVGFAPRFISDLRPDGFSASGDELDLRLRVAARREVAPHVAAYGYVAAGYSQIFLPDDVGLDNPSGLIVGAAAGVRYTTASRFFVGGELGYQIGRQGLEMDGTDARLASQFLHLGLTAGITR